MKGARANAMDRVKSKAAGLSALAMSMALPHENKAQRLPLVPVTQTSVLEFMSDATVIVGDGVTAARRYVLFRDPCYPLWGDVSLKDVSLMLVHSGAWTLPAAANTTLPLPAVTNLTCQVVAGSLADGLAFNPGFVSDRWPVGKIDNRECAYVPSSSFFIVRLATAADQTGKTVELDFESYDRGEWRQSTVVLTGNAGGLIFSGTPGGLTPVQGTLTEGTIPGGFVKLVAIRTSAVAPTVDANPILQYGFGTGAWADQGAGVWRCIGTATPLLPLFRPPEFENSTIPYAAVRATATAALFTNVTATLAKEGTVLAARLRPTTVNPWDATVATLNSVHPRLRYYGPLEKGLYTFTTPTAQDSTLVEAILPIACTDNSTAFNAVRPAFSMDKQGYYNAMIFTDTGNSSPGTVLAVSLYTHVEFESTSSLFVPGVSTYTLEQLHAAEVALLQFGHFHENPLHWAAIRAAAGAALRFVGPMVAPIVQQVGSTLLSKGVALLKGNQAAGDRTMQQAQMVTKPRPPVASKKRTPRPKAKGRK